jgi:hypothetical protein
MDEFFDDALNIKKRAKRRLLKVTYPDGKTVCYNSTTRTFMEVLRRIGVEKLQQVDFKIANIPFISQTLYPKYQDYQKELVHGWYVMTQSDSGQKYRQLLIIKEMFNLDFKVELGEDFETDKAKSFSKGKKPKSDLLVAFPDGEYVGGLNPIDTYKETLQKIGMDAIMRRHIEFGGKPLIATSQLMQCYEEIAPGRWLHIPNSTKEKVKFLKVIGSFMHVDLEITII